MTTTSNVDVIRLWQLPDDFFALDLDAQWRAISCCHEPGATLECAAAGSPAVAARRVAGAGVFAATLVLPFLLAGMPRCGPSPAGTMQQRSLP